MTAAPVENVRHLDVYGGNKELFYAREDEVLLDGPAGTGKSIACLMKVYLFAEKYAGARCLIVRKTRLSLTEAGLVTWEDEVVPKGHPCLEGPQRSHRHSYKFPNGSEVVVGGLDKSQKVMSTAYDLIYVQEAIELEEGEWEDLTTRLRKRSGGGATVNVIQYRQIIADTNPDKPTHWLNKRCLRVTPDVPPQCRRIESRHEDNPGVVDQATGQPTEEGAKYLKKLDNLNGSRKDRLRFGKWVQSEGVIYDGWDTKLHIVKPFPIPAHWRRFWALDWGYTNPLVWLFVAEDDDGRLYVYREIYLTGAIIADAAEMGLKAIGAWDEDTGRANWQRATEPRPVACIGDHGSTERPTFERVTRVTVEPAEKAGKVTAGIQEVAERLRKQDDGKPRLFLFRDARMHAADKELLADKKPTSTAEEFDGYVWDPKALKGEKPLKEDDHGMDGLRYLCYRLATKRTPRLTKDSVSVGGESPVMKKFRELARGNANDDSPAEDDNGSFFARHAEI